MGVVSTILGLPLAPVRGVIGLGELIQRRVDEERHNLTSVRRELEAAEQARAAGEISTEEEIETQQEVLDRLNVSAPAEGGANEEEG